MSFKIRVSPLKPFYFYQISWCSLLILCCHFNRLHSSFTGIDFIQRNHLFYSSVGSSPLSIQILSGDAVIHSHLQAPLLNLALLPFPPHLQWLLPLKAWAPQSHPGGLESTSFKNSSVNVDTLTSFHESWMFLKAARMVNPFQKVFNWFCPDPLEESLPMAAVALQNIFLK